MAQTTHVAVSLPSAQDVPASLAGRPGALVGASCACSAMHCPIQAGVQLESHCAGNKARPVWRRVIVGGWDVVEMHVSARVLCSGMSGDGLPVRRPCIIYILIPEGASQQQ
jgi:hypothetical protein